MTKETTRSLPVNRKEQVLKRENMAAEEVDGANV
jgi:hypothetical protein